MNSPISILLVDDTKFSSAVVRKLLKNHGFADVRVASTALEALAMIKERHVDVMIADWLMPDIDGLELTKLVRAQNRRHKNFTYILLLTAKEGEEDLREAFDHGVDDFVGKTTLKAHLIPRVHAARRMAVMQNSLLKREAELLSQYEEVSAANLASSETNLSSIDFLSGKLERYIRHCQSRNGHVGLMICKLTNLPMLEKDHGENVKKEMLQQASQRIVGAARPLDEVAQLDDQSLALIMYSPDNPLEPQNLFKRIEKAAFIRAYSTPSGYLSLLGSLHLELMTGQDTLPTDAHEIVTSALGRSHESQQPTSLYQWTNKSHRV